MLHYYIRYPHGTNLISSDVLHYVNKFSMQCSWEIFCYALQRAIQQLLRLGCCETNKEKSLPSNLTKKGVFVDKWHSGVKTDQDAIDYKSIVRESI